MASAQFQVLSALCRIVRNIVSDAVNEFSATIFVSPRALSRTIFDTYTDTLVDQFNKTTLENFRTLNGFISSIIDESRFISALRTNFYTRSVPDSGNYTTFSGIYPQKVNLTQSSFMSNKTCRCDQTSNCIYPAGIYNQSKAIIPNEAFSNDASLLFAVPGVQVGCVPQNALLQSTLECFYNQSCLDIVITLTGALRTVSALNISNSISRFHPTTTIGYRDRVWNMVRIAYEKVTTFNLFKTALTDVEQGIYSTRVYILFLMVGVYVLTIYSTKVIGSKQVIVQNPSINQFEELNKMYSSILSCPCSRLSMPRSTFMHYEVQFHPFCTSRFIRDELWLQYWTMEFLNALNADDMITFKPKDTVNDLIMAAFIDQQIQMADYESYYTQCQPEMCIYTIDQKLHSVTLVNSVIGLLGGLSVVLRLLIPLLIKIIYGIYRLCLHRTRGKKLYASDIEVF
ncbi:unnamed protein product [Rotaria sp. Silwood1]|nr:unnamed protein product [Rotaria sp. Silwood1]CAF3787427.1 unnamed protein product [Rotaria sp. Silwood1]CAF4891372.1 unnamed protein product [Rotaria sp. Silwood1]CAF4892504.1 unnamed protein product [Rotaria sp. Silwood1]CAF4980716.1 unnamed protein product [Rotaria sp. Silwood1]